MILNIDTNAAYLVLPKARSRIAAYYYLSNNLPTATDASPPLNAAITVNWKTILGWSHTYFGLMSYNSCVKLKWSKQKVEGVMIWLLLYDKQPKINRVHTKIDLHQNLDGYSKFCYDLPLFSYSCKLKH